MGFVHQVVQYVRTGYWFFVAGTIPAHKTGLAVDEKILRLYDIRCSPWTRARRKKKGRANLHYLRFENEWVLMATKGSHSTKGGANQANFFRSGNRIRDARRSPIRFRGYAISYRRGKDGKLHALVRIDRPDYQALRAWFLERALHRKASVLAAEFHRVPFEPYKPIYKQLSSILVEVNRLRRKASFEVVPKSSLRVLVKRVKVFEPVSEEWEMLVACRTTSSS